MTNSEKSLKVAVVGCGVAGLTAAWLLNRKHDVHLFEKNDYAGGHTRTLHAPDGTAVDTGFIVMNYRNYPLFAKVLEQLGVVTAESSMTFSYEDREDSYAYSGNSLASLFPNLRYFFKKRHASLLYDLWRFARIGYRDLMSGYLEGKTLGAYLEERSFGHAFKLNYLYPMGAAIWSSPIQSMAAFPAQPYLHFLENHGLLRLTNRPQWRYIPGGSRTYVEAMLKAFKNPPLLNSAPQKILRSDAGVQIITQSGATLDFDHVIIGTHADEALSLLGDPSKEERTDLGAWQYQANQVVLHSDVAYLPENRKLWSSWNFIRSPGQSSDRPVSVSYYMNRLQRLESETDYVVTLNPEQPVPEEKVINLTTLTHPLYSFEALASQSRLSSRNGSRNTWLCGSYFGYGFHEDAVRSAIAVAEKFGIPL